MKVPILPSVTASSALPVGTRMGEFEITGVVGEGGFGIVYSAHDSNLDRMVAIKEYWPTAFASRTDQGLVQVNSVDHDKTFVAGLSSFIKEARMLARFSHPGLVEVFRFWEANGTAYMAMRYYLGVTLRELLRTTPHIVTEQWLRETLDPLLLALKELHIESCYHRDIAPDNILILHNGRSVLMDFGASRRIIGGMTQTLTTILKPGFAPIEQYSDDGLMMQGAWTDIYAIGGLLYNAMTGKVPVQAISRMMSDPLRPVAELARSSYSPLLCGVVMKCLAVLPADRYQSVDELRAALGWVAISGVSTVSYQLSEDNGVHQDSLVTVIAKALAPQTLGMDVGDLGAESDIRYTGMTKPSIRTEIKESSAGLNWRPRKSTSLFWFGIATTTIILAGVAATFYADWHKPDTSVDVTPSQATGFEVPAPVRVISESREPASSVRETLDPLAVGNSSQAPVLLAPPDKRTPQQPHTLPSVQVTPKIDTAQATATGTVRVELKNGWGTVFVDGDEKGVAPPLITVKLSPGSHIVELRNPAVPTVKLTVQVIAEKTVTVRHVFTQ